jgi:(4S)-4-hydroxy-5-phosphonooxypentane-2,3-dione isomerase
MIATCVFVKVKAEFIEEFKIACKNNHEKSLLEPGNLRFDILQEIDDKCKFTFYEAYINDAAVLAHKLTPHYLEWKTTVESYMAEPRKGIKHKVIFPDDQSKW